MAIFPGFGSPVPSNFENDSLTVKKWKNSKSGGYSSGSSHLYDIIYQLREQICLAGHES